MENGHFSYTIKNMKHCSVLTYTFNVWRAVASSGLHRNIIILLKVYASVASWEKLTKKKKKKKPSRSNAYTKWCLACVQNLSYCSRRSLGAVGLDQSSSLESSAQRVFPPEKPPRSYLYTCMWRVSVFEAKTNSFHAQLNTSVLHTGLRKWN